MGCRVPWWQDPHEGEGGKHENGGDESKGNTDDKCIYLYIKVSAVEK